MGTKAQPMSPGCVVEYLQGKELALAFCLTSENKGKVQVLSTNGKTESLASKKVLFVHPTRLSEATPREEVVGLLASLQERKSEQAKSIDLEELWELLSEEDDGEKDWTLEELVELSFDQPNDEHRALLFRALIDEKLYFVRRAEGFRLRSKEQIEESLTRQRVEAQREVERAVVKDWMTEVWHQRKPQVSDEHIELIADWKKKITEVALFGENASHFQHVQRMFKDLDQKTREPAFHFLVRLGVWTQDENLELLANETPTDFPEKVLQEAEEAAGKLPEILAQSDREDLTGWSSFSVDDAGTTEIDDAFAFRSTEGGYEVAIHIADASAFMTPDLEALEREAQLRATSVYLPDFKVRMVPEILSDGAISLLCQQPRAAFTCRVRLDREGVVQDCKLGPSVISVADRLDYDQVDSMIDVGDEHWKELAELAALLKQQREARGAVMLPFARMDIRLEGSKVTLVPDERDTPSQLIVSEMMILANQCIADYLTENKLPAMYRCQKVPEPPIEPRPVWLLHHLYEARKSFSRSYQSLQPEPHSGLGLARYVQATSPIRRYRDLMHQRQVLHHLRTGEPFYDSEALEALMTQTQLPISQAEKMERNRKRYFLHKYLKARLGQVVEAVVLHTGPDKYVLALKDSLREVDVPHGSGPLRSPGEEVKVKLISVYPRDGVVKVSSPL